MGIAMDYSQLSDFEINKRVAELVGGFALTIAVRDEPPSGRSFDPDRFDPCNNAADAWPIIAENNIAILPYKNSTPSAYHTGSGLVGKFTAEDNNPLRAAMVVFLMMRDSDANQ
jgi:hypothetical protein